MSFTDSNRKFASIIAAILAIGAPIGIAAAAVRVNSIDFKVVDGVSQLAISADGPLTFEKVENPDDRQVVIELKGAELSSYARRKLDTSSFDSPVSLISPYRVTGTNDSRIVIQLRKAVAADIQQSGGTLQVSFGGGSPSSQQVTQAGAGGAGPVARTELEVAQTTQAGSTAAASGEDQGAATFEQSQKTKKFVGKPITIQVKDAELTDVFRLLGEASGFNIIVGEDVKGKISLSLVDVPWDQVLDLILQTQQLGAERNNNILRVVTLANFAKEKQIELQAKQAAEASAPRVTRLFPISYAKLSELQSILMRFGNSTAGAAGATTSPDSVTIVQADERTNSIIVRDTPENVDKMQKLIELLDTQTPQVMIEAKIVEATESFSNTLNGSFGIGAFSSNQHFASFSGANPIDRLVGDAASPFETGRAIGEAAGETNAALLGASPTISFIPGVRRLNALLSIGERENQVKVVSSPKTVVLNKESSSILSSEPVLVPTTTFIAGVGSQPTESVQDANLSLNVQPTVTNEGSVLMQINLSRDVPQAISSSQSGIGRRNMTTKVLVESGATLVIGGIYTSRRSKVEAGFPFLRKIPLIGWFFGSEAEETSRSELFIFITPRILNEKEAGLSVS